MSAQVGWTWRICQQQHCIIVHHRLLCIAVDKLPACGLNVVTDCHGATLRHISLVTPHGTGSTGPSRCIATCCSEKHTSPR